MGHFLVKNHMWDLVGCIGVCYLWNWTTSKWHPLKDLDVKWTKNTMVGWVCIINVIPWNLKNLISICVEGNWVCTNLPPRYSPFCWIYHISKVFIVLAYVQEFCCDLISCAFSPIRHKNIHLSLVKLQHVHILSKAKKKGSLISQVIISHPCCMTNCGFMVKISLNTSNGTWENGNRKKTMWS
jgi:hypothetical protein